MTTCLDSLELIPPLLFLPPSTHLPLSCKSVLYKHKSDHVTPLLTAPQRIQKSRQMIPHCLGMKAPWTMDCHTLTIPHCFLAKIVLILMTEVFCFGRPLKFCMTHPHFVPAGHIAGAHSSVIGVIITHNTYL